MHATFRFRPLALAWLAAMAVAACAQSGERAGPALAPGAQRVIVTTVVEWPSAAEVGSRIAGIGRVPVRDTEITSPRNYRMTLDCVDAATCHEAVKRIAEARTFVQFIGADERQRVPRKPERDASQ